MKTTQRSNLFHIGAVCIALLFAPGWVEVAQATCGGGGGGGAGGAGQSYKTHWTATLTAALSGGERDKQAIIIYFQPKKEKKEHSFFSTKMAADWSKKNRFVKVEYVEDDALREVYHVDDRNHVVHICDWHGNSLRSFQAKTSGRFNSKSIGSVLKAIKPLVQKLEKKLNRDLASAEKSVRKEKWAAAIKSLNRILKYKGYDAITPAKELMEQVVAAGEKQIAAALELEKEADQKKKLKAIRRTFKNSDVEAKVKEDLDKLGVAIPVDDDALAGTGPSVFDDVWNEQLGTESVRDILIEERADRALRGGIIHEKAGDYEKALESYALAAGLDINDPVPLVYLGELYRHHLGRWEEARNVFQRVIDLDNDDLSVAIALHGIGKMTIWGGDNATGLAYFNKSIKRQPTSLCYRNLAVYWFTEGEVKKAFDFATKAYELDPEDSYNKVFYSVHLRVNGFERKAVEMMSEATFDVSMSYNYACYHATQGNRELALKYLRKHFFEYEQTDAVRSFEMAEARMDAFFAPWYDDAEFLELTSLAGETPWLGK